ncbi:energy transducer TonB [Chitinophaga sp.]|uniref:energy transducer TonB n=1 Tax=Chitinophaga sp. TaxID=1869181 RepID=UPI0031DAF13A
MRHIIPILLLYLSMFSTNCLAQSSATDPTGTNTVYYSNPANRPTFPGGENGLTKYLRKNLQYPQEALESGIEGTVTVQFTINEDGTISHVTTISPKLGGHLEMEAIRLIRSMPNWKPAIENGKPVPAECNIPIIFSLKAYYAKKRKVYPMF